MKPSPVLTIDTKPTRPRSQVRINGKLYALRTRDDLALSPDGAAQRGRQFQRLGELFQAKKLTDAQVRERRRLLVATAAAALAAPAPVLRRLSDRDRVAILEVFLNQNKPTRTRQA